MCSLFGWPPAYILSVLVSRLFSAVQQNLSIKWLCQKCFNS